MGVEKIYHQIFPEQKDLIKQIKKKLSAVLSKYIDFLV